LKESISKVTAREILDSRGNPTIEVEVTTEGGATGIASVPSGASKGKYEAVELRDGGKRYHGMGVGKAIRSVTDSIAPKITGVDVREQRRIDQIMIELDGSKNKENLGANSILGVSIACAKAASLSKGEQLYEYIGGLEVSLLPIPFFNIINGGKHAGNKLDFQEFMVVPVGARSFGEAVRIGSEVYHALKHQLLYSHGKTSINVGDEGGFAPPFSTPEEALDSIMKAINEMGYQDMASLGMDVAATTFFDGEGGYTVAGKSYSRDKLIDYYTELVDSYPIISIEDPLHEEDFQGFRDLTQAVDVQILGDDIFVTNRDRLKKGIEMGAANALLWKVNQVGTLTEALESAEMATKNGYAVQASHRSGDTEDPFVADLAVGIGCGQIKAGAPCRGERTAKYNRLLRIEEKIGGKARYPSGLLKSSNK